MALETDGKALDQPVEADITQDSVSDWDHKSSRSGSVVESFYHAIHGLKVAIGSQRNLRIHLVVAPVVLTAAIILKVEPWGVGLLLLSIGLVIAAELINTAIEHLVDIQSGFRYHLSARYAKDTAAAGVLVSAAVAAIVGAVVFLPRILTLLHK